MTDAPERIWADKHCNWWGNPAILNNKTEYIRADLSPSPEVVKELVEALRGLVNEWGRTDPGSLTAAITRARAVLAKLEGGE